MPPLEPATPELAPIQFPDGKILPPSFKLEGEEPMPATVTGSESKTGHTSQPNTPGDAMAAITGTIAAVTSVLAAKGSAILRRPALKRQRPICDEVPPTVPPTEANMANPTSPNNAMQDEDDDATSIVTPGAADTDPTLTRSFDATTQTRLAPCAPRTRAPTSNQNESDSFPHAPPTRIPTDGNIPTVIQVIDPKAVDEIKRLNYQLGFLIHDIHRITPAARAMQSVVTRTRKLQESLNAFENFIQTFY